MEGLLISFLYLCLRIAIVLLIAAVIVWVCHIFKVVIDEMVYKIGKIVVMIIVIILIVQWLFGIVPMGRLFG